LPATGVCKKLKKSFESSLNNNHSLIGIRTNYKYHLVFHSPANRALSRLEISIPFARPVAYCPQDALQKYFDEVKNK
jgi:hypothetical protein